MKPLYLDSSATRALDKRVVIAMTPYFSVEYGNPSSPHALGEKARKAVDSSRSSLAKSIGAKSHEIIFTSGTSESDSWVFQGLARAYPHKKRIVVSAVEHAAVMETCAFMKSQGYTISIVPVSRDGSIDMNFLEGELKRHAKDILVVSIMHANNVIGTIQPISVMGKLCRSHHVLFHTDAAQTFAKLAIDVHKMNIDLLSASAHKIGGPKGTGLLYVREGVALKPLIFGGGQERGLRGGTENVPGIVGFAKAAELFDKKGFEKIYLIRERLIEKLEDLGAVIHSNSNCLVSIVHASFRGVDARVLVAYLSRKGIYISTGSACESTREKEDHVLKALGLELASIKGAVRITLTQSITKADIDRLTKEISHALKTFSL